MSSIVSRRPSSRNHWNEAFWMSIRLGRSRTWGRRENDLRARGEATLVVKKSGLPVDWRDQAKNERADSVGWGRRPGRRRNLPGYRLNPSHRKRKLRRSPGSDPRTIARSTAGVKPVFPRDFGTEARGRPRRGRRGPRAAASRPKPTTPSAEKAIVA